MGRKKPLTEEEKGKIKAFIECGQSHRNIAKKIGRSQNIVSNFIRKQSDYGKNMKGRTHRVTTKADRRAIIRAASNSCNSAAKIKQQTGVTASLATVKRIIRSAKHLKRLKIKKKPPLNATRKAKRLQFAREYMSYKKEWQRIVFSDEKKFNLEGPDGYNYYFHDLRKEERYLSRLHSCEGSVMVWGAISYYGTCELQFLSSRMNAINYKSVLEKAFPHFSTVFGPIPWIFQQDNAPIHSARLVKEWIRCQNVDILEWPPYSPDLNIIENVWGLLSRKVYESGRQYENKEALIEGIKKSWAEISLPLIENLYNSLPNRIFEVISNKGGYTHY